MQKTPQSSGVAHTRQYHVHDTAYDQASLAAKCDPGCLPMFDAVKPTEQRQRVISAWQHGDLWMTIGEADQKEHQ